VTVQATTRAARHYIDQQINLSTVLHQQCARRERRVGPHGGIGDFVAPNLLEFCRVRPRDDELRVGGREHVAAFAIGKAVAFIALMLFLGKRVVPAMLGAIANTQSRELFVLGALAAAVGTALASAEVGRPRSSTLVRSLIDEA
jgi:hypothetical protein